MEVNKDEADRCIELATKFIKENNKQKAEKFLRKAERLFPSPRAKSLLRYVQLMTPAFQREQKTHKRKVTLKTERPSTWQSTREQHDTAKRIKTCKNYYEMLGISKDATESDIRKAYKKLALQLHPDKNESPSAVEAFKAIGNAVSVLIDPEKRKQYDKFKLEKDGLFKSSQESGYTSFHNSRYEFDTSDELFDMFFGSNYENPNAFPRRNGRVYRQNANNADFYNNQREHVQQDESGFIIFFQILPILLAILLSMASSVFISDATYSLQPTAKYSVARETENLRLLYYTKETFNNEHLASIKRLEAVIEEEYLTNLGHDCHREKNYRNSMMWKAKNSGDQSMFKQAQEIPTPSCEKLQKLHRQYVE